MRENDHIILVGEAGEAEFSHLRKSVRFYRLPVAAERLSGAVDVLNVLAPEEAARALSGRRVLAEGEVRSYNNRSGEGAKLVISVLARRLEASGLEHRNELELGGFIVREPIYRRTPMGREITDLLIAVPRNRGRSDYLPVIAWGAQALDAAEYRVGDEIRLRGRLQSRKYLKNLGDTAEERTAFEISAGEIRRV